MDIVSQIVKLNAQTNGRDKLCRLFQYGSKCGWWYVEEYSKNKDLVTKLKNLENHLSATRKVLRFGKSLDLLQGAYKSMGLDDIIYKVTLTLGKINQALYLYVDHILWASKIGLMEADTKKWGKVAARFWLITIIFNLLRNVYDILTIFQKERRRRVAQYKKTDQQNGPHGNPSSRNQGSLLGTCVLGNQSVVVDTVKNVADLFLPLSSLGYVDTSPGVQGILGIIGSFTALMQVWNPLFKLSPA